MNLAMDIANVKMELGQEVKNWRETRDMSFLELSQKAKISKGTLSQIERGKDNPTLETIIKLRRALRIGFNDLIQEPES